MKGYLLDTHIFLWLVLSPDRLPLPLLDELRDLRTDVYVSAGSFWEIAMLRSKGRIAFEGNMADTVAALSFRELPISGRHSEASVLLPLIHKDPFDRLLAAQAASEDLLLVTHDAMLQEYDVPMVRL